MKRFGLSLAALALCVSGAFAGHCGHFGYSYGHRASFATFVAPTVLVPAATITVAPVAVAPTAAVTAAPVAAVTAPVAPVLAVTATPIAVVTPSYGFSYGHGFGHFRGRFIHRGNFRRVR